MTELLLTDDQEAIIAQWARLHSDKLRAVLLYGSRYSGIRTPKDNPPPIPDVDLALSIRGADQDTRFATLSVNRRGWENFLSSQLGGLPVQIVSADGDIGPWVAAILNEKGYKVLWKDPEHWFPTLIGS